MRTNKQNQSPGKHWGHGEALTRGPAGGRAGQRLGWGRPRECQRCQPEPGFPPPSQPPVLCWTLASQRCPADLDACPPPCRRGHLVPTWLVMVFRSSLWQFTVNFCSNEGKPLNKSPPKEHGVLDSLAFLCRMHLMVFASYITHQIVVISDLMQG